MHMSKSIKAVASVVFLLATSAMATEAVLECSGSFSYCSNYSDGNVRCDVPKPQITVVAIEGNSISQVDGAGFLTFKDTCETEESNIQCSEMTTFGTSIPASEEKGKRNLTLYRTTGRLDWTYESTYGPEHSVRKRGLGITGKSNKYQAQCKVREHRNLF